MKLTQEEFAKKTEVSLGSIKRFENTGEISLFSLTKIAIILDCDDDFMKLFSKKHYNSIEEILNEKNKKIGSNIQRKKSRNTCSFKKIFLLK